MSNRCFVFVIGKSQGFWMLVSLESCEDCFAAQTKFHTVKLFIRSKFGISLPFIFKDESMVVDTSAIKRAQGLFGAKLLKF